MKLFSKRFLTQFMKSHKSRHPFYRRKIGSWILFAFCSFLVAISIALYQGAIADIAVAQGTGQDVQKQENDLIKQYALPSAPAAPPVYRPQPAPQPVEIAPVPAETAPAPAKTTPTAPASPAKPEAVPKDDVTQTSNYVLEFNRSPSIGNRFRLEGVNDQVQFGFTRPRNWKIKSAKATIRYRHSPALLASHSNLMVRVNDTGVGSTPLKLKQSQTGTFVVDIPPKLIQDYTNLTIVSEQNNSQDCSNPSDPNLWTEVLPDSKIEFVYEPQPVALDFSRYPYPFFDDLNLDANRIAYLSPNKMTEDWLTSTARLEASLGRLADYRPMETRLIKDLDQLRWDDRLAIIGTSADQPALKSLQLPFAISNDRILDGNKNPFPKEVGILMLATTAKSSVPVLVATGNSSEGVANAVQFLVQPDNREIGTGRAIIVNDLAEVPSPDPRQWSRYLPLEDTFKLSDLKTQENKPFQDVTVRGASAPPVEFAFRALPDDHFNRGNSMTLVYSYSPQVNPRTSSVDVSIDGAGIGGKRLTSVDGGSRETLKVNLPENLIKPDSKIQVSFRLSPRDLAKCGVNTDKQLWGTVHSDTSFQLKRYNSVQLPDLKLMTSGFPFAAPQDLSNTAIVLPEAPSKPDVATLLDLSERLGRLSQSSSIKLEVYTTNTVPASVREQHHLIGIGIREKFPFPEAFKSGGFQLKNLFSRQWNQSQIQTLPDSAGVIKEIISPWNRDRVLLALTGQAEAGLRNVQQLLNKDLWFYQLRGDTVLIKTNQPNPSPYDKNAYQLQVLEQAESRRIENTNPLNKATRFFQDYWFFLPTGIVTLCILLYGISQLFLKRVEGDAK